MIQVDRKKVERPDVLNEPYKRGEWKGKTERQKVIEHFNNYGTLKDFNFTRYNHPEVKKALANLFHFKCAYCESYFAAVHSMEVEHYRPKSVVIVQRENGELEERYGYYWLASDWENLLPSCIDCNRQRYHEISDGELKLGGKKSLFPLKREDKRAKEPGDEFEENSYRLLLDPCCDRPEEHLEFAEDGVVKATIQSNDQVSLMGKESINVYALWRPGLTKARKEVFLQILDCVKDIRRDHKQLNNIVKLLVARPGNDLLKQIKETTEEGLTDHMAELFRFQESDKPYTGMARQIIKKKFPNLG